MRAPIRRWLVALLLGSAVAWLAYRRQTLTSEGALAAAAIGAIVFARGGTAATAALLAFFVSSSAWSRFGKARKSQAPLAQAKGDRRDAWQVLANGGVATLSLLVGGRTGRNGYVGAVAAASADTWATELGMLSPTQPRLITTLNRVPDGTSGGITPAGILASVGGAAAVGLTWTLCGGESRPTIAAVTLAGTLGSLVDSALGATIQATYRCSVCGQLTEEPIHAACGAAADLERGFGWATNDAINLLATVSGALIAAWSGRENRTRQSRQGRELT